MPPTPSPTCALLRTHIPHRALLSQTPHQCLQPRRQKSSGPSVPGAEGRRAPGPGVMPAQQSARVSNKLMLKKSLPNDLGLLLGTLIMPTGETLPSLTSHPYLRTKMEVSRLYKRVKDFISILSYKYVQKPRLKIHFGKTASTAAALHRQMYTAVADGDTATLTSLTCEGIRTPLLTRISTRPRNAHYTWTLHRYTTPPRVVSHRAAILPIDDGSGHKTALRQAVVRVSSVQSLVGGKQSEEVTEREVTEYVVVQRRVWKGVEERWRVWGTTGETAIEAWEETMNPRIPESEAIA